MFHQHIISGESMTTQIQNNLATLINKELHRANSTKDLKYAARCRARVETFRQVREDLEGTMVAMDIDGPDAQPVQRVPCSECEDCGRTLPLGEFAATRSEG